MTAGSSRAKTSVPVGPIPRASIVPDPSLPALSPPEVSVWIPGQHGILEVVGQADADLEITGVGGIIAQQYEVEGLSLFGAVADDIADDLGDVLGDRTHQDPRPR